MIGSILWRRVSERSDSAARLPFACRDSPPGGGVGAVLLESGRPESRDRPRRLPAAATPAPRRFSSARATSPIGIRPATKRRRRSSTASTGTVFTAGDNAYGRGSASDFRDAYQPTLGPAQGPHVSDARQPRLPDAQRVGLLRLLRRSRRPARARLLHLRRRGVARVCAEQRDAGSRCQLAAGPVAPQRADDAAHPCSVAIWHKPLFTSGPNGEQRPDAGDLPRAL